jgi:hypothetical protein
VHRAQMGEKTTTRISPMVALGAEGKIAVEADELAQEEELAKSTELSACSAPPAFVASVAITHSHSN